MISLTRLNGRTTAINPDLIAWIDITPDTTVSLLGGEKIIVRESLEEVIDRVIAFRRLVGVWTRPPSAEVLHALDNAHNSRRPSSIRPDATPSRRPETFTSRRPEGYPSRCPEPVSRSNSSITPIERK